MSEYRLSTDCGGAQGQRAPLVDGATHDAIATLFLYWDRFACDHGFVDIADALDDLAIDRNPFARAHLYDIAGDHIGDRYVPCTAAAYSCGVGGRSSE